MLRLKYLGILSLRFVDIVSFQCLADASTAVLNFYDVQLIIPLLQSIHGDETVNVNKPSPVSQQLPARSGQRAQLVQGTHCIRTQVNLHSDFGHPCNGTPIT
jgi:hypothetical protein